MKVETEQYITNDTEFLDPGLSSGFDKVRLVFFHNGTDRSETQGTWGQSFISISINSYTIPHPPMSVPLKRFPYDSVKGPHFYRKYLVTTKGWTGHGL